MLPWKTPYVPRVYPNRVDVYGKVLAYDDEGGRTETEAVIQSDVPCSIQQASPQMLQDLGLIGVERARVIVFFHGTVYPGLAPNQEVQQTDSGHPQRLTVLGTTDMGGLGTDFAAACDYVGR
jgi:hypothetical protein